MIIIVFFTAGRGRKRPNSDSESEDSDDAENGRQAASPLSHRNGHPANGPHANGPSRKRLVTAGSKAAQGYQPDSGPVLGIIERVSLENFMCHSKFEWRPNSCVNFVTGANGSGKSSILQGKGMIKG